MPARAPLRIGLLGARRERQGLGPWFARRFEECGARIVAFGGRSRERLDETRAALTRDLGHPVTGHVGVRALIAETRARGTPLDALVIASPFPTHEEALIQALAAGLPTLCEKPMIDERGHGVERARAIVDGFAARGLPLWIHVQWPETLATYEALHPVVTDGPPRTFGMLLGPDSLGSGMLRDALHHPLSLLQAALPHPGARVEEPSFRRLDDAPWERCEHLALRFDYVAGDHRVATHLELERHRDQPRPASYGWDGRIAHRVIVQPGYRQFLVRHRAIDGERSLRASAGEPEASRELEDPMRRLVGAFVDRLLGRHHDDGVRGGAFEVQRLAMLRTLTDRYPAAEPEPR